MNFVLDASVALGWCLEDESGDYATAGDYATPGDYAIKVLASLSRSEAVVPALWPLEVSNGLWSAERRGRLDAREPPAPPA